MRAHVKYGAVLVLWIGGAMIRVRYARQEVKPRYSGDMWMLKTLVPMGQVSGLAVDA